MAEPVHQMQIQEQCRTFPPFELHKILQLGKSRIFHSHLDRSFLGTARTKRRLGPRKTVA